MGDFLAGSRVGLQAGLLAALAQSGGRRAQSFPTYPVPNYNRALYALQIRDSNDGLIDSYIFPLSPESVRKETNALTTYYDVQGDEANAGVNRIIDTFGQTPVIYQIEGTTGWKLHGTDGYQYTGLQSIAKIEGLLTSFARLNQSKLADGDPNLYQLWFLDFFRSESWIVVPSGAQGVRQTAARPLYVEFSFRLIGVRNLSLPGQLPPDSLAQLLSGSDAQNSSVMTQFASSLSSTYSGQTAIAQ